MASSTARPSRYSAYTGGPDPLAPPVDLRDALEQIGQDVMDGTSPRRALSELLRRGTKNMRGADRLAAEANRRRRELLSRNNLDGTLQEVKRLLDEAVLAERKELARALDDDARFSEMQLESLPPSPAKAVQELADYEWRSDEAREKYEQIKDLLGREMLDQRFAGMKEALENATDEDRQRVNEMLDDLNELLDKHASGRTRSRTSTTSWPSTASSSRRTRATSTSCWIRWPSGPPPRSGSATASVPTSAPSWMRWRSRLSARRR